LVCISTVYCFTCVCPLIWNFRATNWRSRFLRRNVRSEVRFSEVFLLPHFWDVIFSASLRFLQCYRSRFYATYHSSSFRQNILSTSYKRNTKVQIEQKSYSSFRRIDSSKLTYRLTINTFNIFNIVKYYFRTT
jgi:hypothetical protein